VISRPSNRRVGVYAVALGAAVTAASVVADGVPLDDRYALVVAGGLLVLLAGGVYYTGRDAGATSAWRPQTTESRAPVPIPGDDLGPDDPWRSEARALAVSVVARTDGVSRAEAERRVRAGEWTDDPVAAAAVAPDLPIPEQRRLFGLLTVTPDEAELLERTAAAVRDRREGSP
jgi:hypothetical protein